MAAAARLARAAVPPGWMRFHTGLRSLSSAPHTAAASSLKTRTPAKRAWARLAEDIQADAAAAPPDEGDESQYMLRLRRQFAPGSGGAAVSVSLLEEELQEEMAGALATTARACDMAFAVLHRAANAAAVAAAATEAAPDDAALAEAARAADEVLADAVAKARSRREYLIIHRQSLGFEYVKRALLLLLLLLLLPLLPSTSTPAALPQLLLLLRPTRPLTHLASQAQQLHRVLPVVPAAERQAAAASGLGVGEQDARHDAGRACQRRPAPGRRDRRRCRGSGHARGAARRAPADRRDEEAGGRAESEPQMTSSRLITSHFF